MEEVFAVIGLFTLPLTIVFAVAWWNARKELWLRREIARDLGVRPNPVPNSHPETQRLEDAVEAIALEVERLAEGQRFVARLLSERPATERGRERHEAAPLLPHITPH
jgi:hypothetical protein